MEDSLKVIVNGGFGFVGSHVVDELVARGCRVFVIDDLSSAWLEDDGLTPRFANPEAVRLTHVQPCDAFIHLALRHPVERERAIYRLAFNGYVAQGTRHILDLLDTKSVRRVIVGSTINDDDRAPEVVLSRAMRAALGYWHRPPSLGVYFAHLPELEGARRLPECEPRPGVPRALVTGAAKMIADLATTAPHRRDPDVVMRHG